MKHRTIHIIAALLALLLVTPAWARVVLIPEGVHGFQNFESNTTYRGAGRGKTIIRNRSAAAYQYTGWMKDVANVVVEDMTFEGNGVLIEKAGNVTLRRVEFRDAQRKQDNHQCLYINDIAGGLLEDVSFHTSSHAMMLYWARDLVIQDVRIEQCGYGLKLQLGGQSGNILIQRVVADRMTATMGIEIQGDDPTVKNITVQDVAYVNPLLNWDDNQNRHAFGVSAAGGGWQNLVVQRVFVDGLGILPDGSRRASTPSWKGVRVGVELAGAKSQPIHRDGNGNEYVPGAPVLRDCWLRNLNDPVAVTTSRGAIVTNNLTEMVLEAVDFASPANGVNDAKRGSVFVANGATAKLPSHGGWSLVGRTPPGAIAPGFIHTAEAISDRAARIKLANVPAGTAKLRIHTISTVGRETGPKVGPAGVTADGEVIVPAAGELVLELLHPGWSIDISVEALDAAGDRLIATPATTIVMPGDPTLSWPPAPATQPSTQPSPRPIVRVIAPPSIDVAVEQE